MRMLLMASGRRGTRAVYDSVSSLFCLFNEWLVTSSDSLRVWETVQFDAAR